MRTTATRTTTTRDKGTTGARSTRRFHTFATTTTEAKTTWSVPSTCEWSLNTPGLWASTTRSSCPLIKRGPTSTSTNLTWSQATMRLRFTVMTTTSLSPAKSEPSQSSSVWSWVTRLVASVSNYQQRKLQKKASASISTRITKTKSQVRPMSRVSLKTTKTLLVVAKWLTELRRMIKICSWSSKERLESTWILGSSLIIILRKSSVSSISDLRITISSFSLLWMIGRSLIESTTTS